ncbi:rab proteins geranylgeranyltransferase component A [Phlebotomus argentipes]|uniref:rab proteins geranylgeranyltransferase component A n=1 Tax=Phlebotomus argentipes TaxID=94469 RepID=UPI00289352F1|nr:rab proteins geranylgeranyltransferase component A [Phlebotomus argentipes]
MTEDREDLPKEFDLTVIGTGLTESIVAAAASRIGKSVLHLDVNEYYGSYWASFNLRNLQTLREEIPEQKEIMETNEIQLWRHRNQVQNVQMSWHVPEDSADEGAWTQNRIMRESHKFNIDLAPKLLFARGAMVELLISSNICRYAEFRAVDRVATLYEDTIRTVPCSRADVFNTQEVTMVEKRLLMKMLETCMQCEEGNEEFEYNRESTFLQYLEGRRLPQKLTHYLLDAISMSNEHTSFEEGILRVRRFIESLGRYGNTPFLFPMYGCGELPQCFCRLCAVFGGIYCLRRPIERIMQQAAGEGRRLVIQIGQQEVQTDHIVFGSGSISITGDYQNRSCLAGLPEMIMPRKCGNMSRGIFLVDSPLGGAAENTGGGGVALLKLPPAPGATADKQGAFVIQLSHQSGTCPPGLHVIHITCDADIDPRLDLQPYVDQIFTQGEGKPRILYSLYFTIPQCFKCDNYEKLPAGVHLACGPYLELDYDTSINQGRELFRSIYPNEEFLPRCPEPEEIVI